MSMTLPAGAVKLGEKAYLFPSRSAAAVTDCFIVGHGGLPSNGRKGIDYKFTVPNGCTVNFLAKGGQSLSMSGPVSGFTVIAGGNGGNPPSIDKGNSFASGKKCGDYIIAKALGTHAPTGGGTPETMAEKNYAAVDLALQQVAGPHAGLQWLPHYVSIRNRTSWIEDTNVFLSKLIELIRAHDATIVNFYCAHCRDNLSDAELGQAPEAIRPADLPVARLPPPPFIARCCRLQLGDTGERIPHRDRQHGRSRGARRQAVGRPDPALAAAFQHRHAT